VSPAKPRQEILHLEKPAGYSGACWVETDQHRLILSHVTKSLIGQSAELWIHGPEGVGKTHLGLVIADRCQWSYYDCGDIQPDLASELLEWLDIGVGLVLDRVDCWLRHAEAEAALFSWWKRKENGLVLISTLSPRVEGQVSLADLTSRAHASMILPLNGLADSDLAELFLCQLNQLNVELTPEVSRFLGPRLPRNPRKLMQLVRSIDRESLRDQRKITIPWLKQLLLKLG